MIRRWGLWGVIAAVVVCSALAAAGGAGILFQAVFRASGTGATDRTAMAKLRDQVSVKDFGAVGDGVTNDRAALVAALTAASAAGGGTVVLPRGSYAIGSSFSVPANVWIMGMGPGSSKLLRTFTGDFITDMGSYAGLDRILIDGQTATYGAGIGVRIITAGSTGQQIMNTVVQNFVNSALQFEQDAGTLFVSVGSTYYTTGTLGTVGAIKFNGVDSAAASRSFFGTESMGCTLYDFGGCNDCYVYGGYSNGLIFNDSTAHANIAGMRIGVAGGTVTVKGGQNHIMGSEFAGAVIFNAASASNQFYNGVSSNDVTDLGTGNVIMTQNFAMPGKMVVSGAGPHAIGGATSADIRLRLLGPFTGTTNTWGLFITDTLTAPVNGLAAELVTGATINKAASGTHNNFDGIFAQPPTIGAGASTLSNAASIHVSGAPSGANTNRALWVEGGLTEFGGNVKITSGVAADGAGLKHLRTTTGCATAAAAGATCDTTVTWTTTFADANETPVCEGFGITSGVPVSGGMVSKLAASVVFRTVAMTAVAAQYTNIYCHTVHD